MTLFSDPVFKAVVSAEISMLMAEPELAGHLSELNIPDGGGDVQKAELINGCLRYNRDYIKS